MSTTPTSEADEERRVGGEGAGRRWDGLLAGERAGDGQRGDDEEEPTDQHREAEGGVVPIGGAGEPAEGGAVVVAGRGERVGHLREPMRVPLVPGEDRRERRVQQHRGAGEPEDHERHRQDVQHHQLHLGGLDLLAEELRRAAHHEPRDEHRQQGEDEHAVEPGPTPPGLTSPSIMLTSGARAAERGEAVVGGVDGAGRRAGGGGGEQAGGRGAEPDLLALHVAAGLPVTDLLRDVDAEVVDRLVAADLEAGGDGHGARPEQEHGAEHDPALLLVLHHAAVGVREGERDEQDDAHLHEVGEAVGVGERVGGVGVEGAAAVRADLLDGLLPGERTAGDRLGAPARGWWPPRGRGGSGWRPG